MRFLTMFLMFGALIKPTFAQASCTECFAEKRGFPASEGKPTGKFYYAIGVSMSKLYLSVQDCETAREWDERCYENVESTYQAD